VLLARADIPLRKALGQYGRAFPRLDEIGYGLG
jgi:hypothetical protein